MTDWTGKWLGGRTRPGRNGATVWVIDCTRHGVAYSISLGVSEQEALAEFALFERNPQAYSDAHRAKKRGGELAGAEAPAITDELVVACLKDALSDPEGPISKRHAKDLIRYLSRWQKVLDGKDLRKVTLAQYREYLRRPDMAPKRHMISALKTFTHWLRRDGRLKSGEDASRDLEIPQSTHKRSRRETGYKMADVEKLYANIRTRETNKNPSSHPRETLEAAVAAWNGGKTMEEVCAEYGISVATLYKWRRRVQEPPNLTPAQAVRDVIALRALCGMHQSEIERLAAGDWKVRRVEGQGEIKGVVVFFHKKGLPHPQALCAKALAAAERLQKTGIVPDTKTIHRVIDQAAEEAGLGKIRPNELRHSFITWSLECGREVQPKGGGVSLDTIRRIVGHTAASTTEIYNGAVPPMVALPIKLENVEDPVDLFSAKKTG